MPLDLADLAAQYDLDVDDVIRACTDDPVLADYVNTAADFFYTFKPRPDDAANFDQQTSFVEAKDIVSFMVAGNGSGKTEGAAYKCARFLLCDQPPPRKDTPFWILNQTKEMAADVCWKEKLIGNGHLPTNEVEWQRISWEDKKMGRPSDVPLKPWPREKGGHPDKNWTLEFKSYDQGRAALQSKSIGGFWFSEQFPADLLTETMVRCRDYLHPGGQFAEFTPLEPDLCIWLEQLMEETPDGWRFYRGNTECNRANLATGAIEAFLATVPDELIETRLRGALASFEGAIYPTFSLAVHVVDDEILTRIPSGCWHALGTDWGSSIEHPHVTLWGCIDGVGDWWIYDEYWSNEQTRTTFEHAQAVVERCAAWGWPTTYGTVHNNTQRILKLNSGADPHFGVNFADPSRPGEINNFSVYGVPTMPAANRVYDGINLVRSLLKMQVPTGRPRLHIARRCKHTIDEMRKYRWRRGRKPTEGSFLNPVSAAPIPLKRDDDSCFIEGTPIQSTYGNIVSLETIRKGDKLLSHLGVAVALSDAICVGNLEVYRLTLEDGRKLIGTADHQVASGIDKWTALCESDGLQLNVSDQASGQRLPAEMANLSRRLFTAIPFGDVTQSLGTQLSSDISTVESDQQADVTQKHCTGKSILTVMAQSPADITFTTAAKMSMTTGRIIWSALQSRRMLKSISQTDLSAINENQIRQSLSGVRIANENTWSYSPAEIGKRFALRNVLNWPVERFGPVPLAVASYLDALGVSVRRVASSANDGCAVQSELRCTPENERRDNTHGSLHALCVARLSPAQARKLARQNVHAVRVVKVERLPGRRAVYNLATSHGTYFANGILVSNCDALRYLVMSFDRGRGGGDPRANRETPIRKGVQLSGRGNSPAASRGLAGVFKPGRQ